MQNRRHRLGRSLAPIIVAVCVAVTPQLALGAESTTPPADAFPPEQIVQLVAPIALYPDALIAQILMASTYPLDVVQAKRWLDDHEDIEGGALDQAVKEEPWDDSVKALVFFPSVVAFMNDNLDWTQDLGDAVLAQQGEVTETIQRLRAEADRTGALASNEQQRVEKAGDTIIIQPAQPEVVYVPTYDPVTVYGESNPPAQSYYPDAYADATASYQSGYAAGQAAEESASSGIGTDSLIGFGVGALAGGLLTAAIMWDDDDDWNDRLYYGGRGYYGAPSYWARNEYWDNNGWREPANITVDRSRNLDIDRNVERGDIEVNRGIVGNEVAKWEHNPERRGGVRYRDASTENRFAAKRGAANINRDAARGRLKSTDRQVKAPNLDQVRREGAAGGKVAAVAETRPAGGDARAKVQAKAPAVKAKAPAIKAKAKPKVQAAAATKRPVNREVKRPAVAPAKRPAAASKPLAQRPAVPRASAPKASAFKASKPAVSRAASNRGGASRAAAGQRGGGGGAARGGGGLRR
ncbi:DUF3300 domain-containing protein [Thiocapsa rosea]|uniref:Uncharacterized protein DUF3300 n=1 Tax=Thiocapsa rosea TaxID=69360 RepID=A0A495V622_9GAMM|nr:DUF3300 domain-containing protein [Thiocapsa rosea]RKT44053.1 uncharacterized protein DUF3300 [Thiocapsa rosea]